MIGETDIDAGLPDPPPDDGPGLFGEPAPVPAASAPAAAAPAKPYRVLARAYRPTRFEDLIGQDAMVRILRRAFALNRVAHAFMLTGVRGVGKTTSARIIARALNCIGPDGTGGPTSEPCGVCPNCTAILADRHPDVLEMDAASRTGIDDVREIIEATRFRPMQARMKVFIVDEVHMLSKPAFNALLKTLEEPPSQVTFIFATTELRKVPVTVLSRCQRFDLRRVSIGELSAHFARIAEKEGAAISADALALIARAADGSVRDGLSLLDQAIAQGPGRSAGAQGNRIGADQVADMLGLADRGLVFDLLDAVMAGRADTALNITDQAHARGADLGQMLADLLELIHTVSRLKSIPALRDSNELPEAERVRGAALADALSVPVLGRAWQMLLKGVAEVEGAPDRREAAEMVLIRLCHVADLPTPGDLVRQIQAEGPGAAVLPVAMPASTGTAAAADRSPVGAPDPPSPGTNVPPAADPVGAQPYAASFSDASPAPGGAAADRPPVGAPNPPLPGTVVPPSAGPAAHAEARPDPLPAPGSASARRPAVELPDPPSPGAAVPSAGGPAGHAGAWPDASPALGGVSAQQPPVESPNPPWPEATAVAAGPARHAAASPGDAMSRVASPAMAPAAPAAFPGPETLPVAAAAVDGRADPARRSAEAVPPGAASVPVDATLHRPPASVQDRRRTDAIGTAGGADHAAAAPAAGWPIADAAMPGGSVAAGQDAATPAEAAPVAAGSPGSPSPSAHRASPTVAPAITVQTVQAPVQGLSGGGALRAPHHEPDSGHPDQAIAAPPPPDAPEPPPALRSWREVVAFVNGRRMARLHGNLMHCAHLVRFRPPVIELALESGAPKELSQQLAAVLLEASGTRWSIVVVRDEPGEPTLAQQAGLVQADLDRDAGTHPLVQAILAAFPGAVVGPVTDRSLDEYYALPPEQAEPLLAEPLLQDGEPPDMEFAPEGSEPVGLDDLAAFQQS